MSDFDDEPTAEEQAEAEALARALERGDAAPPADGAGARAPAPADAVATAALLRHAARAPGAAADRQARLSAAAARVRLPAAARPRPRRWRLAWLVPAALVPALAAMFLLTARTRQAPTLGARDVVLPAPDVALLQAQARAARGGEGLAALDRQMRGYRARFYERLAMRGEDDR
jgi:hypothetical protein